MNASDLYLGANALWLVPISLLVFGVAFGLVPGLLLRAFVLLYPRNDPRRQELFHEMYAPEMGRFQRYVWVFQQLETALRDGIQARREIRHKRKETEKLRQQHARGSADRDDRTLSSDGPRWPHTRQPSAIERIRGLVERTQFDDTVNDLDFEVARWADTSTLAGVRGGLPGTITFVVGQLTAVVNVTRSGERQRIDGWLVPAGAHGVEVRVAELGSTITTADEGGRFVLTEVPRGITQLLVHMNAEQSRTVVTPAVDL